MGEIILVSVTNIFVPSLVLLSFSNHCLRLPRKMKIVFVYCEVFCGNKKVRCAFIFLETAVSSKPRALYFCGEIWKVFLIYFLIFEWERTQSKWEIFFSLTFLFSTLYLWHEIKKLIVASQSDINPCRGSLVTSNDILQASAGVSLVTRLVCPWWGLMLVKWRRAEGTCQGQGCIVSSFCWQGMFWAKL